MAIIRDNRGALLASNISKYLAGAANTAGTPIDTTELVKIMNQFLGANEQISSDVTSISNGIYKRFMTNDTITNKTEIVTSGIWSGDVGSLTVCKYYNPDTGSDSGKYYLNVYPGNYGLTSSLEPQFAVAYGDYDGYGSPSIVDDDNSVVASKAIYSQLKNVLLDTADQYFSVYSGSTSGGHDAKQIYAIVINRARFKERLDPGNISINFANSPLTLIDDSGGTDEAVTTAGRVYNLRSGSLNIGNASGPTYGPYTASNGQGYGLFYPDNGIIILNANALSTAFADTALVTGSTTPAGQYWAGYGFGTSDAKGVRRLITNYLDNSDFEARRTENISTSHYFVRANNREFNFSNNPTFVTGSTGQFLWGTFERDPHVYITTVGLYDDANELLAVAKLSKPVEKTFDKEIAIKVKLDF